MFYQMKPSPFRRGFKKDAEAQSIAIRQKLGITPYKFCPARQVAHLYGVSISPAQCLEGLVETILSDEFPDKNLVAEQMAWLLGPNGNFSAIVAVIKEHKMVLYNAAHSPARQESDIMHELAHIICQHPGDCLQLNADIGLRRFDVTHEEEAKWLGATLQIPDQGLFTHVKAGLSNQAIAEIYGASLEMVTFRRQTLGIDIRLNRLKNSSRRKS